MVLADHARPGKGERTGGGRGDKRNEEKGREEDRKEEESEEWALCHPTLTEKVIAALYS